MYPGVWAERHPDKPAHIMGRSGETVTYGELNERSNRLAQLMWDRGLRRGDHMAVFMENHVRYLEAAWAATRSGLYLTTVNSYLTAPEAAYIVDDCDARVLVTSASHAEVAEQMLGDMPKVEVLLMVDGTAPGYASYEDEVARYPAENIPEESLGTTLLYSSGTTGRPKGIQRELVDQHPSERQAGHALVEALFGFKEDMVYLSPAPLYHAAPIGACLGAQAFGATVVVMERFDAEECLAEIERYRVTHAQFVPTMFVRMLKLTEATRTKYDVSSLERVIHAAAPCPVPVKQQMIEWWGPKIVEYYGGTELNGLTFVTSDEWLAHPGTVGRPVLGTPHIVDEEGVELPRGEAGTIYFEGGMPYEYYKDPEKTASVTSQEGWTTLGDVGYLDDEGYLYLTDRKAFMIISGGVNIYPQEIENVLVMHPDVVDVAVFGVPNEEMGEEVKAIIQPRDTVEGGPALERQLIAYCRENLAHYKCPRSIDFDAELPRLPTGKLYKRLLRDRYWAEHQTRI